MRTPQEKFMDRMQAMANNFGLDLVVQPDWANTGTAMFQPRDDFEPILSFTYRFNHNYSSFNGVPNPKRVERAWPYPESWPHTEPQELDGFIAAVERALQERTG